MSDAADAFVDANREALVALCGELVAAKSVNPPGDVRAAAGVVTGFLAAHGIEPEILAARVEKPNVVLDIAGHEAGRHLVLNGHLDTIPPGDESRWTVPLHAMGRGEGRLTGLGIGNMKGGVAALALATVFLHQRKDTWPGRVSFTAVADETVFGPDGADWLLGVRPDLQGDAFLCGEGPGFMGLGLAEKGLLWIEVEALAPGGQGMLSTRGSGAPARLAEILSALDALNDEHAIPPPEVAQLAQHAGEHGLRVTANCGRIAGGIFTSQVAPRATAELDIRIPPGLTVALMEARVDAIVRAVPNVSWRRIKAWDPNWTAADSDLVRAVGAAAADVRGPAPAVVRLPASDASRWRARGVDAVCFGPQPTFAAGIDDFVHEQDVVDCAKIYIRAALGYLTAAR